MAVPNSEAVPSLEVAPGCNVVMIEYRNYLFWLGFVKKIF